MVQPGASWGKSRRHGPCALRQAFPAGATSRLWGTLGLTDATAWGARDRGWVDLPPVPPAPTGSTLPARHDVPAPKRQHLQPRPDVRQTDRCEAAEIIDYNKACRVWRAPLSTARTRAITTSRACHTTAARELWRKWLGKVIELVSRHHVGLRRRPNNLAKRTHRNGRVLGHGPCRRWRPCVRNG